MATNGTNKHGYPPLSSSQDLFINDEHVQSSASGDEASFDVVSPMTGEKLYTCASATTSDYDRAITAAEKAFQTWSRTGPSARRNIFMKAADIMQSYIEKDAPEILSAEVSATKFWVKINIMATVGVLRETAGLVTHIKGEIVPADRPGTTILVEREAVGVNLAISPWNAPINLTARAIACPIICGNTVILKPSEFSPKSQFLMVRAFHEAGLPPGVLNFLPSSAATAAQVTEYAVKHPKIRRINFTGSDRVGRIIAGWAAECLKKCVLELGGKAPVIVLSDADIQDAVEAIVFGALSNSGQICMSTERVIVHKSIMPKFKEALIAKVKALKTGNHLENPDVSISGLFQPASAARVLKSISDAVDAGANLVTGDMKISGPNKTILEPHILENVTSKMDMYHKETFGPVISLYSYGSENNGALNGDVAAAASNTATDDDAEAIRLANDSDFSLCASVFSRDILRAMDVARQVRAGSCHINGPTVFVEATLPNGGVGGSSGYGRFGGIAGVEEFTERKIISLARPGQKYVF